MLVLLRTARGGGAPVLSRKVLALLAVLVVLAGVLAPPVERVRAGVQTISTGGVLRVEYYSHNGDRYSAEWQVPAGMTLLKVRHVGYSETNYDWGYVYGWNGSSWVQIGSRRSGSYDVWVDVPAGITKLRTRLTTDGSVLWSPNYTDVPEVQVMVPVYPPGKPQLSSDTSGVSTWNVKVTWTSGGNPAGTVYELWRETLSPDGAVVDDRCIYSGTALEFTTTDQAQGKYYTYRVRAKSGSEYSGFSAKTAYWTAPSGSASPGQNCINLSWSKVMNGLTYRVHYRVSGGSWVEWGTTSNLSATISGLSCANTYDVALSPVLPEGGPAWWSSLGTGIRPLPYAAKPTLASASAPQVAVSWSAGSNPAGTQYTLRRVKYDSAGQEVEDRTLYQGTATSFTTTDCAWGAYYAFYVKAVYQGADSGWGPATVYWTAPGVSSITSPGPGRLSFSWPKVKDGVQYGTNWVPDSPGVPVAAAGPTTGSLSAEARWLNPGLSYRAFLQAGSPNEGPGYWGPQSASVAPQAALPSGPVWAGVSGSGVPSGEQVLAVRWGSSGPVSDLGAYGYAPWGSNPSGWPKSDSRWIWVPGDPNVNRDVVLARNFYLASYDTVTVYAAVDDSATVYLDGAPVLSVGGYGTTYQVSWGMRPGSHVLTVEARNAGGPAGVLLAVKSSSGAWLLDSRVDGFWTAMDANQGIVPGAQIGSCQTFSPSFEDCSGRHVGKASDSNGVSTSLGGGWRAATHYNTAQIGVVEGDGAHGRRFVRFYHDGSAGWKGLVSSSWQIKAGCWYRMSAYARTNSASPLALTGYAIYTGSFNPQLTWPGLKASDGWVLASVVFQAPSDLSGSTYLYGRDLPAGVFIDYDGVVVEELSGNLPAQPGLTGYELQRDGSTVYSGTASGWSDWLAVPGETHRYRVRAKDAAGQWTSWTPWVGVRAAPGVPALSADSGPLGWSREGRGWVRLSWPQVEGANGYRVWVFDGYAYRPFDSGEERQLLSDRSFEAGSFSLKGSAVRTQEWSCDGLWSVKIGGPGFADWSGVTWSVPVAPNRTYLVYGTFRNDASVELPVNLYGTGLSSGGARQYNIPPGQTVTRCWAWNSGSNTSAALRIEAYGTAAASAGLYVDMVGMYELAPGFSFDMGSGTFAWDSRQAKIYPPESVLDGLVDNSATADLFRHDGSGVDLRDSPNKLYRKTAGTAYDSAHKYWFRLTAYGESGESYLYGNGCEPVLPCRTDTTAPVGGVVINNDQVVTGAALVTLYPYGAGDPPVSNWTPDPSDDASGIVKWRFSNDGSNWSSWVDFGPNYSWRLDGSSFGKKTVYAQYMDAAGNVSAVCSDDINYYMVDVQAPEVRLSINGGAGYTSSRAVLLQVSVRDDLTPPEGITCRFSEDYVNWTAWEPYRPERAWTLSAGDGRKTVHVQAKDAAGNTASASAEIVLQTASSSVLEDPAVFSSPSGVPGTAVVNGQQVSVRYVTGSAVVLRLNAPGAAYVEYSMDNARWLPREPAVPERVISLPDWEGLKDVYARLPDGRVYLVRFIIDRTPPEVQAGWLGGATVAPGGQATLVLDARDNFTRQQDLQVSLDGGATWRAYAPQIPVSLGGSGYRTVVLVVRDQAGNLVQRTLGIFVP